MKKQWYKDRIYGFQCRTVSYINDNIRAVPKRKIIAECYRALNIFAGQVKLDRLEYVSLQNYIHNIYRMMIKNADISRIFKSTEHVKNDVADRIEFRKKHSFFDNMDSVFYVCSSHTNCAEGHKKYQGKIYINREAASPEEIEYADNVGIMDIREVMAAPVWLFTRKNCSHEFYPVPSRLVMEHKNIAAPVKYEEPLNSPYRAYIDRKKMLLAVGEGKENDSYKRTVSLIRKHRLR